MEIHGALYVYWRLFHTREQLRAELREAIKKGIRSGETEGYIEITPEFWRNFKKRSRRNLEEIRKLSDKGKVGNLLLPKELYEFISERLASGECKTPTDVVCAAVLHLRQERRKKN